MKRKITILAVILCAAFGLLAATGVVSSTKNPLQVALLHWYPANQVPTSFPAGGFTVGVAFDGGTIWAANAGSNSNSVMRFRTSDGLLLGTFLTGGSQPTNLAFDGANMWVSNSLSNNVAKIRASDGALLGTFSVGTNPSGDVFDGANIWVANAGSNNVTKLRARDGVTLGTFGVGTTPIFMAFDGTNIWVTIGTATP